jgi:hypothetical protein
MTYRQKAEQLLVERMGVSEYAAAKIIRLLEQEGEYTPRVLGVLNAAPDAEEWDEPAPESETK